MEIGIGLPTTAHGVTGEQLAEFARHAERRGFSSLAVFDRLTYDSYEPLVSLAAAAAVTSRIRLMTYILSVPLRGNANQLARQVASVQKLSGGRLVLGAGLGAHPGDYALSGVPTQGRGRRFDAMLETMRAVWAGEPDADGHRIGGALPGGAPVIVIGGDSDAAVARAASGAAGWVGGNGGVEHFARNAARVTAAWSAAGRDGAPLLKFAQYFALGEGAAQRAEAYLRSFYGGLPAAFVDFAVSLAISDVETLRKRVADFAAAGCGELMLFPVSADPEQIDLLAGALEAEATAQLRP